MMLCAALAFLVGWLRPCGSLNHNSNLQGKLLIEVALLVAAGLVYVTLRKQRLQWDLMPCSDGSSV